MPDSIHVVTGEVRLSYVHLLQPYKFDDDSEPSYSTMVLVPKSDAATKQRLDAAIEAAILDGTSRLWNGTRYTTNPLYDGDGKRPNEQPFSPECKGHWVFTAGNDAQHRPSIVDVNLQNLIDPAKVYSGVFGRVGIDIFPYNNPRKKGVGFRLINVQILRDGEPLSGGSISAEEDFGTPPPAYAAAGQAQPQYQQPQYAAPAQLQYPQAAQGFQQPQYPQYGYGATQPQYGSPSPNYGFSNVDPLTGLPTAGPSAPMPL